MRCNISFAYYNRHGRIKKINQIKPIGDKIEYKGILNLWHIDSFEGGLGSRRQFLLDTAVKFERENNGVYVNVSAHTVDSAEKNFNEGIFPDMISYGIGLDLKNTVEIDSKIDFSGGEIGDKLFSIPWCMGSYVLICKENLDINACSFDQITVSKSSYNNPELCMYQEGITANNVIKKTPLEAYMDFVSGKVDYFLGSQRDIVRLNNRNYPFKSRILHKYNDYFQYISILSDDEEKIDYSNYYIELLLSENIQKGLKKIGMFSAFYNVETDFEALRDVKYTKETKTLFALIGKAGLDVIGENLRGANSGDENAKINIKNALV